MNFKKMLATVVAGASLLTMVGTASAISTDINIYGASAQFNFWKAQAPTFLAAQGCTGIKNATKDSKNAITQATCGGTTVNFRTSSKASYDGPLAIQGNTTNPNRVNECSDPHQRKMVDETSCGTTWAANSCTATKCVTVTGGASDVQVTSFQQESHGMLLGPSTATTNVFTDRNFKGTGAVTSAGLANDCRSLIVPFGFFANSGVGITNITTAQARLIFSAQVADWTDLGVGTVSNPITACFRHAGSGTHAAMDLDVMRPAAILNAELLGGAGSYNFWFNDGTADLMNCVNGASGGVGYADADATKGASTVALTYNGVAPTKANIENGLYDFYTTQNLYMQTPAPADMTTLCSFMKNPANNINAWYTNVCNMKLIRSDDTGYSVVNTDYGVCQ
jgi:ABC-type phosphate transport system substrate-binding protein